MLENIIREVEEITQNERFITLEQLENIESINGVYVENCGISGTGKGQLFTLYLMLEDGSPDLSNEILEVVVIE